MVLEPPSPRIIAALRLCVAAKNVRSAVASGRLRAWVVPKVHGSNVQIDLRTFHGLRERGWLTFVSASERWAEFKVSADGLAALAGIDHRAHLKAARERGSVQPTRRGLTNPNTLLRFIHQGG